MIRTASSYFQSTEQDFPRASVCVAGCVVRQRIVSRAAPFSRKKFSLSWICLPSSIDTIVTLCFSNRAGLSYLAFESDCEISILREGAFACCSSLQLDLHPFLSWDDLQFVTR
jgi:hypothetical protein